MTTAALLALCAGTSAGDSDWNQFLGPRGARVAAAGTPLPALLDTEESLRWSSAVDAGASSPCVVGGLVFVTGQRELELSTTCIDLRSGEQRWRSAITVEALEKTHPTHGPASPSPVADGERVIVSFGSFGLAAYDHAGKELWRKSSARRANTFGSASSPILSEAGLVVLCDSNEGSALALLDPSNGETIWERERPDYASGWSTPMLRRDREWTEILAQGDGWLDAYDLADGSPRWSIPGLTDEAITTPALGDGLVVLTSYNMRINPEVIGLPTFDELLARHDHDGDGALNRAEAEENASVLSRPDDDGEGDHPLRIFFRFLDADRDERIDAREWPKLVAWLDGFEFENAIMAVRPPRAASAEDVEGLEPRILWQFPRGVPECPSPLVHGDRVWTVMSGGLLTCLDARSGELVFQERLASRGPYYASPVAGDGKLYLASARGDLTVMALADEPRVLSRRALGERLLATPALVHGSLVVRTESRVRAFREGD